jgi:hypothetical protein
MIPARIDQGIDIINALPVTQQKIDVGCINFAVTCKIYDFHL